MNSQLSRESDLAERLLRGEVRALARVLTLVENQSAIGSALHQRLYPHTGKAHVIGVTGPPGAGKSSLVNEIALSLNSVGNKVAVLAVDPSSPYSGGAVLGDRIRMERAVESDKIFVRSMASRGALGGLSNATADAIDVIDAAGFSHILVETVGVGQGEVDIARTAQTSIVVLVPGMGDEVQVMKAGILEIADLFVINKAERSGVHALERELRILMMLVASEDNEWKIPILRTIATKPSGIEDLIQAISNHKQWLDSSGAGKRYAAQYMTDRILQTCSRDFVQQIRARAADEIELGVARCLARQSDPRSVAGKLFNTLLKLQESD